MPSAPELPDGLGHIGVVEIFHEVKAEHFPQADGHIRVAGKIIINLKGVEKNSEPGQPRPRQAFIGKGEHIVHHGGKGIGKDHLFSQAIGKPLDAVGHALGRDAPSLQLGVNLIVFHNRPGDELGEKANVERQIQGILLHPDGPPVHVHHIGQGLEGVEGNADGKDNLPGPQDLPACQVIDQLRQEIKILIISQKPQVDEKAQGHEKLPMPLFRLIVQKHPKNIVDADGEQHQKHKFRLAPGIKKNAGGQQKQIFRPDARDAHIRKKYNGQEVPYKYKGTEKHF